MSDQSSNPLSDEPDHPLPPESTPTADQPAMASPSAEARPSAAAPPPAAASPTVASDATAPPGAPPGPPAAGWPRRRGRPGPLLPVATGLIGLMLGMIIGAAGLGLAVVVARQVHHGPAFRGDDRGQHLRDNRPMPRPGQFGRPGRPVRPGQVNPTPAPTPS